MRVATNAIECNCLRLRVITVDLKDVLGQIQADCGNLHLGGSSHKQFATTALWRIATPVVAGAIHPIRFAEIGLPQ